MKRITVVDRYVHRRQSITKFGAFSAACSELGESVDVRLLTSETPYLQMSTNYAEDRARAKYAGKLAPHCSEVLFMESTKNAQAPHNRYIIVESSTETRFFEGSNTLFQGEGEKRFILVNRILEPDLFKHLELPNIKEEKA